MRPALVLLVAGVTAAGMAGCTRPPARSAPREPQVLFVCEHGNVKSVMAASYFNDEAKARGLHAHATSRASASDPGPVPAPIAEGLRRDGYDVSRLEPRQVAESDVVASRRVVLINTDLPGTVPVGNVVTERWNDVPAASADFAAARDMLREHVRALVEELARTPVQ
jgi:arsenate reductase